jgi:hypothetical protein
MATNISWLWQTAGLGITDTNLISFYGAGYGDPIRVGEFQKSTHIRKSLSENTQIDTGGNEMFNYAYVSDTEVSVNGAYPLILSGNSPTAGRGIRVTLRDAGGTFAFRVLGVRIYAFSGADTTVPATGVELYFFEFGQSRWNRLYGSANPALLTGRTTPATSHTWEIGISVRPTQIVDKTATLRLEADIQ